MGGFHSGAARPTEIRERSPHLCDQSEAGAGTNLWLVVEFRTISQFQRQERSRVCALLAHLSNQTKLRTQTGKHMKTATSFATILLGALCQLASSTGHAQDLDSMPPVVVKTFPEAGARDVSPGVVEIRVTFSKEMKDHTWSWSTAWQESTPEI